MTNCGDCRKPRYAEQCNCEEHLRFCEEQQRAERAERDLSSLNRRLQFRYEHEVELESERDVALQQNVHDEGSIDRLEGERDMLRGCVEQVAENLLDPLVDFNSHLRRGGTSIPQTVTNQISTASAELKRAAKETNK